MINPTDFQFVACKINEKTAPQRCEFANFQFPRVWQVKQKRGKRSISMKKLGFAVVTVLVLLAGSAWSQETIIAKYDNNGKIAWEKKINGYFSSVTAVPNGVVVTGMSYENGIPKGVIVKYDNNGKVAWEKKTEGTYTSVTVVTGGVVAVGMSIIVKYDSNGKVVWEKTGKTLSSVTTVSDGIVAAGFNGNTIIAKYDNNGNVAWEKEKNFVEGAENASYSLAAVSDGIIMEGTFPLDMHGDMSKGVLVKYDNNGNIVWEKQELHYSATAVPDGVVSTKSDGIIVKYDNNGKVVWEKKGSGRVIAVPDGIVAIGSNIAKYDNNGKVAWEKNFKSEDGMRILSPSATAVSGGVVLLLLKYPMFEEEP
jgi:antitoxin component YwqK of YwqJK toxin-antitoxin module